MNNLKEFKGLEAEIRKIVKIKFPDYTEEEITEMLTDYGEMVIYKFMDKVFSLLKEELDKEIVGSLMAQSKVEAAINYAETKGVDMVEIYEFVATEITKEMLTNG